MKKTAGFLTESARRVSLNDGLTKACKCQMRSLRQLSSFNPAEALIITARGRAMGADSGLPTYRGRQWI